MRMWLIDPKMLCNQHLLGEHVEMHMFVGAINKGKKLGGYTKNGLVYIPHIRGRHTALAAEMRRRGMKHNSPLPIYPVQEDKGYVDILSNTKELKNRCAECKFLMEG